jgi:transposase
MSTLYIGLDVHQLTSTYCVLDQHGKQLHTITVKGRWPKLITQLQQLANQAKLVIAYEASLGYGTLYDQLQSFCQRVVVAHPGRLRLIFRSKRKNDRIDAQKIATLLFMDQLPQVHVPDLDVRAWRETIEFRTNLIHKRTRCKNGLRALLRSHAIASPRSLWTRAGLAWLAEVQLPTTQAALRRDILIEELEHLQRHVQRVTEELDRMAQRHPGVALLRTVHGIGPRTAEAFLAYVDDPHRFAKVRRIGAYLGLVPSQDSSASVNRLGHITRQGPATLRRLLVEASWRAIDKDAHLRETFERITAGKPERRKTALVAVSHKLARIMLAMLKSGCVYEPPMPREAERPVIEAA